ncbi:MAG: thioredoxin family protein [Culicoidibacterales bacterium]
MTTIETMEQFENFKNQEGVVIYLFSAQWCGDCIVLAPQLPAIEAACPQAKFYYLDRDQFIDQAIEYDIFGIPSFIAFKDGKVANSFVSKDRKTAEEIITFVNGVA